jgi:hypothetical protein
MKERKIVYFLNNSIFKRVQYRSNYYMVVYLQRFIKLGMHREVTRTVLRGTARIRLKVLFPTQGPLGGMGHQDPRMEVASVKHLEGVTDTTRLYSQQ